MLRPYLNPGESKTWVVSKLTKSTTLMVLSFPAVTKYLSLKGDVITEETWDVCSCASCFSSDPVLKSQTLTLPSKWPE